MAFAGYIRFPTIFQDTIVFTAEDDLWRIAANGGRAERLTAGLATALHPHFSPNGEQIAYVGREEGHTEVYLMAADGGPAQRLTYQAGGASIAQWKPDGSAIIYSSSSTQPSYYGNILYSIAPQGGEPISLPYGLAHSMTYGPNGIIIIGRNTSEPAHWKRYRGGRTGYFWVDSDGSGNFKRLLNINGNMTSPCWVGDRFYFLSDHDGIGNIYSCNVAGEDVRRHTYHTDFYARNLTTDGTRCVYHAGGDLYIFDPVTDKTTLVPASLGGSQTQRSRKFIPYNGLYLESGDMHPRGHSVAVIVRGKAFTLKNYEGAVLQHGEPDGIRYRFLTWLGNGKRLVAVSDDGIAPQLVVFSADNMKDPLLLPGLDIGHVLSLRAAPIGEKITIINHRNEIMVVDISTSSLKLIDKNNFGRVGDNIVAETAEWSPDGLWITYAYALNAQQSVIKIANIETGESHQVTDAVNHDLHPAFDPGGRYLYFIGTRTFDPVYDHIQVELSFPKGTKPYVVILRKDMQSPFVPATYIEDDEDEENSDKGGDDDKESNADGEEIHAIAEVVLAKPEETQSIDNNSTTEDKKDDSEKPSRHTIQIDLEGIQERIVPFPVAEGLYIRVQGAMDGVAFASVPVTGSRSGSSYSHLPYSGAGIDFYNFKQYKSEHIVDSIANFTITPDGRNLFYRTSMRLRTLRAGEKPTDGKTNRESGWIDIERVQVSLQPLAEWHQMFAEAWRLQREQYWTADMAGINWQAVYDRYAPLVDRITSRGELSDLIKEMQGELGTSHAYETGGDHRYPPMYFQGFLGVNWNFDEATKRYYITHIVKGDPWDKERTSPLLAPGKNVHVGDAVTAINGQRLTAERGPQQLLVNQAGHEVQLVILPANGDEPFSVTVQAINDEDEARYRDWVNANTHLVHTATNGKVGYIHIPDMGPNGYAEFHRAYLSEFDHEGLIIDVRWNSGGHVSRLILEKLARRRIGYGFQRWGPTSPYPANSPRGPMVALTDEHAASDGDIFSHAFKLMELGPLVGKRTWGGIIGIHPYIRLADGTTTTQPEYNLWFKDVHWGVENYGTEPDIEVDYTPQDYAHGVDPQLQRAISVALEQIEMFNYSTPEAENRPNLAYHPDKFATSE